MWQDLSSNALQCDKICQAMWQDLSSNVTRFDEQYDSTVCARASLYKSINISFAKMLVSNWDQNEGEQVDILNWCCLHIISAANWGGILDEPAQLITRLLFGFASVHYLSNSTKIIFC